MKWSMSSGVVIPLYRGPFQNNGATPWYCEIGIGTPNQTLKVCFDTGSNFNWVTSSLCAEDSCKHYAGAQFNISESSSFELISSDKQSVNFGPWGEMLVETGRDILCLPQSCDLSSDIYLACDYSGTQFAELDWDGGIGLPSGQHSAIDKVNTLHPFRLHHSTSNDNSQFHFFLQLIQMGLVSKDMPYLSFITDATDKEKATGSVGFGVLDLSYASSREYIYLPWSCYQEEVSYLWSSSGATVCVDGKPVATDMFFSLDTGSSQFKGDDSVLTELFNLTQGSESQVSISLSDSSGQVYGEFDIPSDIYQCEIEEGEKKGQNVSQFQGLVGVDGLLLVGSVLMDHLYTVYEYDLVSDECIEPKGIWVFNKPNGPKIIKTQQSTIASLFDNLNKEI